MTSTAFLKKVLQAPPLAGYRALLFGIAAITLPTLIRASVQGSVSGIELLPYLPFVLASALMLRSRDAAAVALVSTAVANYLFVEPRYSLAAGPRHMFYMAALLVVSALVIGLVRAFRHFIEDCISPNATDETRSGIVFSEKGGQAWASWYSGRPAMRLGPHLEVAAMMEDYLAQVALGKRLTGQ